MRGDAASDERAKHRGHDRLAVYAGFGQGRRGVLVGVGLDRDQVGGGERERQYPLVGRTLLFALPSVEICIGEGAGTLLAASRTQRHTALAVLAAISLGAIAYLPMTHVLTNRDSQELRSGS